MTYAVRVVQVALDRHAGRLDELAAELPESERDKRPQVRRARAATHAVLAGALGVAPSEVRITRVCARCGDLRHGKPALVGEQVSFNVSHSGELALIAIGAPGHEIGVDVEAVKARASDLGKLAARTLTHEELMSWAEVPEADRLATFLGFWTAKEAYLKGIGAGIAQNLRELSMLPRWTVRPMEIGAGYVASLAVDASDVTVSLEEWRN